MGSAPFGILVGLFDKLQSERKHDRRKKLIDAWFNKDRERAVYGLKEKNLAKTYIKLIPLGMRDPDAIRLLNWKKPTERDKTSGDFPTVLYEVVSKRSSIIEGSLSIDELNDLLDELSKSMGKQEAQSKILQRVYNRTTPEEQRWIVRVILKGVLDMNIAVKETTVFAVFHPDAQDLYNTCSDLKKVAWELWDQSYRLNAEDKEVQLFHAFAPMLCKRPTKKIEDSVREMGGSEFIIEEKLDGERMQLHKRGNEYFYCSRKGKDYTYLYGKHVGAGSLTPFIDKAFDPRIDDIILDGEMLVWDPVSERNLPFGTLKTAALDRSKKEHNPRPCFKVFDLLYLNGQSLLHRSTSFRKKNMRNCLKEITGRIEFAIDYKGKTAKDVRDKMDEVMAARGEGLVIKHPLSKYVLNGRNMDWIKVKPEYMVSLDSQASSALDVHVPLGSLRIIWARQLTFSSLVSNQPHISCHKIDRRLAGNYGTGKRGGGVSTLICAVLDDRRVTDDDEELRIHANGGTCAQIATNQPELFIVYGGKVTPYDLKLLIDKGIYNVLKPDWVKESVALGAQAPLSKKSFFHASNARQATDEYNEDEGTEDDNDEAAQETPKSKSPAPAAVKEEQPDEEVDPALAEWFKVDKIADAAEDVKPEPGSETDADSDNADVADEDDDLDDWFKIKEPSADQTKGEDAQVSAEAEDTTTKMGESDTAMECFYLDSPGNANANGMTVKSKLEKDISKSFAEVSEKITENGGRVVGLEEPKLTHIVIDKRDDSRRLELIKRTSKPKRRQFVVSEFIEACLEEQTLLDEEGMP
ncbi:hypothetical protein DXG03_009386 [Asterophora parasitica]|uniref:DNA ligase n=1 Tax=Asterophora parasitica TaxID=117018 RepID=A0A9P7GHK9_9AGAR|nr:hypothetical protein DXG03_009386 [Asterophora parasitica]